MNWLRRLRLLVPLFGLVLILAARPMPPEVAGNMPLAHSHTAHVPVAAPDSTAPRDLACEIGCIGGADPVDAVPYLGPVRRMARLRRREAARRARSRKPRPQPYPPRLSVNA